MIKALSKRDKSDCLAFLYEEPEINLYIIGDIYNGAFDNDYQQIYGEYRDGKLFAVMSRNMSNLTYYALNNEFNAEWIDIFNQFDFLFISGKEELLEAIKPYYPSMREDKMDFMKSTTFTRDESIDYSGIQILTTREQATKVFDLIEQVPELFTLHRKGRSEAIEYFMHNSGENGTTVFIEDDHGKVVASASAVFETKKSAMIVAVATHESVRGQGYGRTVMHYLMDLYINHKDKTLCLYYDDPIPEKLYKSLHFIDIARWSMLVPDDPSTQY